MSTVKVGVLGAGNVGCYIGICLSACHTTRAERGISSVTLVGRQALVDIGAENLCAYSYNGKIVKPGKGLTVTTDPSALKTADVILVTCKSFSTVEAAKILSAHAADGATIVSFQNGLSNAAVLREYLGSRCEVIPGVVMLGVYRRGDRQEEFCASLEGRLFAGVSEGYHAERMQTLAKELLVPQKLPLVFREEINDILAAKVILNSVNGVCAATNNTTASLVCDWDARWCIAHCMLEGLTVLRHAGFNPKVPRGPVKSMALLPLILLLPDAIFGLLSKKLGNKDAKLSTLQDLEAGKRTEIDFLNGSIVNLAKELRGEVHAPANFVVTEVVHSIEGGNQPVPFIGSKDLRKRIKSEMQKMGNNYNYMKPLLPTAMGVCVLAGVLYILLQSRASL